MSCLWGHLMCHCGKLDAGLDGHSAQPSKIALIIFVSRGCWILSPNPSFCTSTEQSQTCSLHIALVTIRNGYRAGVNSTHRLPLVLQTHLKHSPERTRCPRAQGQEENCVEVGMSSKSTCTAPELATCPERVGGAQESRLSTAPLAHS